MVEESRACIRRTFFGLFLSFYLFQPDHGRWRSVSGWIGPQTSRATHNARPKNEKEGTENEPIVVPSAAQRLLDGCRGPLLIPFWPIVWFASFAHAPPSSFSSSISLLPLILPTPSLLRLLPPPSSFSMSDAIVIHETRLISVRRHLFMIRKAHPKKPIIKEETTLINCVDSVSRMFSFLSYGLRWKNKGDA
jgi:hypothetical protein